MFLDVTDPDQGAKIWGCWVARARFGAHLRLADLASRIDRALKAGEVAEAARYLGAYFNLVDLPTQGRTGAEILQAYLQLIDLNQLKYLMPFQKWDGGGDGRNPPYDYDGRTWAWWVHKLASRYGWSRNDIFDLWPEEAAAYMQEILISEFDDIDEQRSLSELGYTYDKQTGKGTFRPAVRPGWMVDRPERKVKIHRSLIPLGHVVKLDDMVH